MLAAALLLPATGAAEAPGQLSLYLRTGAHASTSLIGGAGGGLGLRKALEENLFIQADAAYLYSSGNLLEVRVGAGVQRPGTWRPAALLVGSVLVGNSTGFLSSSGPFASVGLVLAPLRFSSGATCFSMGEVGLGVGNGGVDLQLGVLEVGTSF